MAYVILTSPDGRQRVSAEPGTPLYNDYIAGKFRPEGSTAPVTPAPAQATAQQPTANPWLGIPSNISSGFTTTEQAQQYWQQPQQQQPSSILQKDPNQVGGQEFNDYLLQQISSRLGRTATQEDLNQLLAADRMGFRSSTGINQQAIADALNRAFPQGSTGTSGATGMFAGFQQLTADQFNQLYAEFANTPEGKAFDVYKTKTLEMVNKQNEISGQQLNLQRQALQEDYQNLLDDLNTGRLNASSDVARQRQYNIQQRSSYLENQQEDLQVRVENINRGYIGRGGLFSGPREVDVGRAQGATQRAINAYENTYAFNEGDLQARYDKAMQSYAQEQRDRTLQNQRAGTALNQAEQLKNLQDPFDVQKAGFGADLLRQQALGEYIQKNVKPY